MSAKNLINECRQSFMTTATGSTVDTVKLENRITEIVEGTIEVNAIELTAILQLVNENANQLKLKTFSKKAYQLIATNTEIDWFCRQLVTIIDYQEWVQTNFDDGICENLITHIVADDCIWECFQEANIDTLKELNEAEINKTELANANAVVTE